MHSLYQGSLEFRSDYHSRHLTTLVSALFGQVLQSQEEDG